MKRFFRLLVCLLLVLIANPTLAQVSSLTKARDRLKVQTLLRLKQFDLSDKPELKAAVLRHVGTLQGTDEYLELVGKFRLVEAKDQLAALMIGKFDATQGVEAARLLVAFGETDLIGVIVQDQDEARATRTIAALGALADAQLNELLLPVMDDAERSLAVRSAALTSVGKNGPGQQHLLALVRQEKLPKELHFAAANSLLGSASEKVKAEAGKYLTLPATADAQPLPPIADLVQRSGDAARGRELFATTGTCAKCHKVAGEGKEVGPDLSEIGSKLSKEAFYVSILDPNAGINFNYETHTLLLADGTVVSGILISQTDAEVTIKNAEAIVRTIPREEIAGMKKQPTSLMPSDLQRNLTAQNLVDIVEYLTTLKKTGG